MTGRASHDLDPGLAGQSASEVNESLDRSASKVLRPVEHSLPRF
jgi:hypothetical protein